MIRALGENTNILIRGKYGIGRSTLVRHVSEILNATRRFWFLDFNETPDRICRQVLAELFPNEKRKRRSQGYKLLRRSLCEAGARSEQPVVLVLDNVGVITPARLDFFHYLFMQKVFSFVVIVEDSMDPKDVELTRAVLHLSCRISLSHLSRTEVQEYFSFHAQHYHWNWSQAEIERQSRLSRGYPLFMAERVLYHIKNRHANNESIQT